MGITVAGNHHNSTFRGTPPSAASAPPGCAAAMVRRALGSAVLFACGIGLVPAARGEPISFGSFKIEVAATAAWFDSQGNLVAEASRFSDRSALERSHLLSHPIVSITNLTTDTSLTGIQLDLSHSGSKITSCNWLEAPAKSSWNWDDPSASAFFQFLDPIAPGDVVTMRLGTAARPNSQGMKYNMNQTLFRPSIGDCLTTTTNFGVFTLFHRSLEDEGLIPEFEESGRPVPGSGLESTVSFANKPLVAGGVQSSSVTTVVVASEPGGLILAAAAVVGLVAVRLGRPASRTQSARRQAPSGPSRPSLPLWAAGI